MNILYTKAGHLRSGDVHDSAQCDFVFSGRVRVWTLAVDGSTTVTTYGTHEYVEVPRGVPHVFEFVEDTVMAEWWEPGGFRCWFYGPYREIVSRCMMMLSDPKKEDARRGCSDGEIQRRGMMVLEPRDEWGNARLAIASAVVGIAGFVLGSRFGNRTR